jgi:hypothetical protein
MIRNTEGLRHNARLRRERAIERTQVALAHLERAGSPINFRTVASRARVSTAWLYSEASLRERIMRLRESAVAPPRSQDTKALSNSNVIAALRIRVKGLEERNRELETRLELVYGQLAAGNHRHH